MEKIKLKAIDLFSGAGGFSTGLQMAGIDTICAIEFDTKIAQTYKYNHPTTNLINMDIRKVAVHNTLNYYPDSIESNLKNNGIDIIIGGPPCQGFSSSGYRIRNKKPFFDDERNKLYLEFYRVVKEIRPKFFIIENVPGILNYDNGNVKNDIYNYFENIGYNVSAKILNASDYGVPQFRKRAFFIGNNIGLDSSILFPEINKMNKLINSWDAISDLPQVKNGERYEKIFYDKSPKNSYQKIMRQNNENYIYNHESSKHSAKTIEILKLIKPGQTIKDLPKEFHTKSVHSGAYGRMDPHKPSYTLTTRINTPSVGRITHPYENRTITPREAARIQSFPDYYRFIGNITTVGQQIGNSVPPILAKKIAESILEHYHKNKKY